MKYKFKLNSKLFLLILFLSLLISTLNAQNVNLQWVKQIVGTYDDQGYSIAVDTYCNVFTTGYFQGTVDFAPGSGTYCLSSFGGRDILYLNLMLREILFG